MDIIFNFGRREHSIQVLLERLNKRSKAEKNGCIIWTGARNKAGYGHMKLGNDYMDTHKLSYILNNNVEFSDLEGLVVMHSCDNPSCINPAHLSAKTQKDNLADSKSKDRFQLGEKHYNSKLTEVDVIKIKNFLKEDKLTCRQIGRIFRVHRITIYNIKTNRTWAHVVLEDK